MPLQGFISISAEIPFLPALAKALTVDAITPNALIFVPTRRAAQQLNLLLVEQGQFSAETQPRIIPLAAVPLTVEERLPDSLLTTDLPPPIAPLTRTRILWQLLLQRADMALSPSVAWQLATALSNLLDECALHEVAPEKWLKLTPIDFAAHWGLTLDFLQIILTHWPAILEERGQSDPATYQHAALMALAAFWEANPPYHTVIVAGSTGSLPATANLLGRIAKLPQGAVILPGFDMGTAGYDVSLTHSQAMMQRLLARCHVTPQQVQIWEGEQGKRARLWSQVLHPNHDQWKLPIDLKQALQNLVYVPCADIWAEAQAIALLVQQALAEGAQRIGIITPDAQLGSRIQQALRRWDIKAVQSLGENALDFVAVRFILHCLALAATPSDPHLLLTCLQHPAWGYTAEQLSLWQELLRAQPFTNFQEFVRQYKISELYFIAEKFTEWQYTRARPIDTWLDDIQFTLLAHCPNWINQAGYDKWEELIAPWREHSEPRLDFQEFAPWWLRWCGQQRLPSADDSTAKVMIWGLLEARLQNVDVAILASLNDGVWPAEPTPNPWLSRTMRSQLGLPAPEQSIGQMAHDFVQGINCAPKVYLTRPMQIDGVVQRPARWLQQLNVYLQRKGSSLNAINAGEEWRLAINALDQPSKFITINRPIPNPPLTARPRGISASGIQQLRQNPYAYYAQRILNLSARSSLRSELSASEIGSLVHHALVEYLPKHPQLPNDALSQLLHIAMQPYSYAFWRSQLGMDAQQRLESLLQHALLYEMHALAAGQNLLAVEAQGKGMLRAGNRTISLTVQADRIDRLAHGTLNIIDYKTGTPPSAADIERGYHVQLPLAAWLVEQGGFSQVPRIPVGVISFWRLHATKQEVKPTSWPADKIEKWVTQLEAGLSETLRHYLAETRPFQATRREQNYDDYAMLARRGLW